MATSSTLEGGVRRVTAAAALALDSDAARTPRPVWFDVRDRADFDRSRVDRAQHLSEAGFPDVLGRLARDTPLVIYCYHGHASQQYARMFSDFGFREIYSVDGGFEALSAALRPQAPPLDASSGAPTDFSGQFLVGDLVYSLAPIHNDGGVPDAGPDELLASPGTRGVIVRKGHLEADASRLLYVARFERNDGTLGPPVGCLPEELTQEGPSLAR